MNAIDPSLHEAYFILFISIPIQFVAAFLALRLIWISKKAVAWIFIAAAIVLMSLRRCFTLYEWYVRGMELLPVDVSQELIAMATSVSMAVGVALIAPLFLEIQRGRDALLDSMEEKTGELEKSYKALQLELAKRQVAEESLRESEVMFRTIADFTYDWEYWRGPDGRFYYNSPSCARITGRPSRIASGVPSVGAAPGCREARRGAHLRAAVSPRHRRVSAPVHAGVKRGVLVAFKGIDGSGKSTQLRRLAAALREAGREPLETCEPTDGPTGRRIREMARSGATLPADEELRWFVEDHRVHFAETLAPALAAGRVVLTDRYFLSTVAYQGARGLDWRRILAESEAEFPLPDLVLLFELGPAAALARARARGTSTPLP